ncbi:MAG: hypothetical protein ACRDNS_25740, partial [Trebonia sp.]
MSSNGLIRWTTVVAGVGIAVTIAVNVLAGLHSGAMGSVIAAWPALALVGSYELLMAMIRSEAAPATGDLPGAGEDAGTVAAEVPIPPATVPETVADTVPVDVPVDEPASTVPPVPVIVPRAVASGRAPRRAAAGKPK